MTFLAWEMSTTVWWLAHSLVVPFLGIGMRVDLFQSCGLCWVFQICWHNECKTLMTSSFRDLNSSAGISSHPLALLTAVLPKVHLTLHSRISDWMTNLTVIVIWFIKIFFNIVLSWIVSISFWSLQCLPGLYHFYPLLCPFLDGMVPWCFQFSWRDL